MMGLRKILGRPHFGCSKRQRYYRIYSPWRPTQNRRAKLMRHILRTSTDDPLRLKCLFFQSQRAPSTAHDGFRNALANQGRTDWDSCLFQYVHEHVPKRHRSILKLMMITVLKNSRNAKRLLDTSWLRPRLGIVWRFDSEQGMARKKTCIYILMYTVYIYIYIYTHTCKDVMKNLQWFCLKHATILAQMTWRMVKVPILGWGGPSPNDVAAECQWGTTGACRGRNGVLGNCLECNDLISDIGKYWFKTRRHV